MDISEDNISRKKMILPITTYGMSVLRKKAEDITNDFDNIEALIESMYETMYKAEGMGLAAPQIGKPIRLFVIDANALAEEDESVKGFKKAFINPKIIHVNDEIVSYSEGCLSIPGIREDVRRPSAVELEYYDTGFNKHVEKFEGLKARIIQHEYDHLEGVLFTDKISPIRKKLLKNKLQNISKGKFRATYKVKAQR